MKLKFHFINNVQKIRTSELRYRRLFEAAQDGILILDAQTGAITLGMILPVGMAAMNSS